MAVETLNTRACRRVACDAVAVGTAPSRVLLIPWGRVESSKGHFTFDQQAADLVVAAFTSQQVDLPIDYEHGTLGGEYTSPDGVAPAAAWIKSLQIVPGEGLFGRIEWTDRGCQRRRENAVNQPF
jgi:phage I-like protein